MTEAVLPVDLSWDDVDPRRHPFDAGAALDAIKALLPAARVDAAWVDELAQAMTGHFGSWAAGWRWAHDEGDLGGGPVAAWCCPRHSITTPDETLNRIGEALGQWRSWLEDLAERFDRYPLDGTPDERGRVQERATTDLVNAVVERTGAGDAWYLHCEQVLTWYLTRWGVPADTAREQVARTVSGEFESWVAPDPGVLDDVAGRLAAQE
ncbi:hypothetical protein VA596_38675 [Amycolatopsis sp., V23-08]|uniref:Uncharacterized protein n=1 Tax=Amycolatopsis heterodermiae TaxID=3110235 RepID=A0ABU5RGV2_9PSEU|nr:hypothetical protein [Amycolatopsis sp., V23-08]MEA5365503.1 hypothetical protein [Amycolatopsis sp., V23-08]